MATIFEGGGAHEIALEVPRMKGRSPLVNPKACLQASVALALYALANGLLAILRFGLWPWKSRRRPVRICLYRIGNIGDIVCALPAVEAVRRAYPDARLTLLSSPGKKGAPGARELCGNLESVNEILVYYNDDVRTFGQRLHLLRELRSRRFDLWIELADDSARLKSAVRNMLFARLTGVKAGAGWEINTIRWFAQAQSELICFPNQVERLLATVARLGIPVEEPRFPLAAPVEEKRAVEEALRERDLCQVRLAVIAPGAKRTYNRWPIDRFVSVGRYITSLGYRVAVLGGGDERKLCQELARDIGPDAHCLAGELSLLGSTEVLRRARFAVCNDSGVQHLAAAVGTPCVALFSSWQPAGKWRPYGEQHRVIRKPVECHTCLLSELSPCPYDNKCIKLIGVGDVTGAIDSLVGDRSAGESHATHEEDQPSCEGNCAPGQNAHLKGWRDSGS